MLLNLRLENIALIDRLELSFEKGFTVLTGETGAGKSILLDALDALLAGTNGMVATRLVRLGSDRGYIEATFSINPILLTWLDQQDLDIDEGHLTVYREWRRKETGFLSRFRVNGTTVNKKQIEALRPLLIDLTGQDQNNLLLNSTNHLSWLDNFGGLQNTRALALVNKSWLKWYEISHELDSLRLNIDSHNSKIIEDKLILDELEIAKLDDPYEDIKLAQDEDRLVYAVKLQEGFSKINSYISDNIEGYPTLNETLNTCINELKIMSQMDSSLEDTYSQSLNIQSAIYDLHNSLENYISNFNADPLKLDELQERILLLNRLKRKYGKTLKELIEYRDLLSSNCSESILDSKRLELECLEESARKERDSNNQILTNLRKEASLNLEKEIIRYLQPMGLKHLRFKVNLKPVDPNKLGREEVEFLFSANPGQPLKLLSDIASGGEMSRFLLALKTALSFQSNELTFLFDEIDSGVSGKISEEIAKLLKKLSNHCQVFSITHQPIIAAAADHHFKVFKTIENGITSSKVSFLSSLPSREDELAELAGGNLEKAKIYAASLLEQEVA